MDLRDDEAGTSFHVLEDWADYTCTYVFTFFLFLLVLVVGIAWCVTKRRNRKAKTPPTPYLVIKAPSSVVTQREGKKKRTVAVVGGTGFVGSHVVEELLSRGDHHVYLLGRRFNNGSEEVRSRVDALIQVDLMDKEGLVKAFRGVDTIIYAAVVTPTIPTTSEYIWWVNKLGVEMTIAAAQVSRVKQLVFLSGLQYKELPGNLLFKSFVRCFPENEQAVIAANGKKGLATCVLRFGQIYGIRDYYNLFLKGQMLSLPLLERPATFQPVEYTAKVILAAADKLAQRSEKVAGKILKVAGWPATFKEFYTLPEWGHKPPRNMPFSLLYCMAKLNVLVAKVTGWAPMGLRFSPCMIYFIGVEEEEVDNSIMEEALGVEGPPNIKEGVKQLAVKFKQKEENKKIK